MSEYRDKNFTESKKVKAQLVAIAVIIINRVISMAFGGMDASDDLVLPVAELIVDGLVSVGLWIYMIIQGRIDNTLAAKNETA